MRNYIQPGNAITIPAPTGGALSGAGVLIDSLFGIASHDALEAEDLTLQLTGIVEVAKAAVALTVGAKVYWDATAGKITTVSVGNTLVGVAVAAAAGGDALARVRLNATF